MSRDNNKSGVSPRNGGGKTLRLVAAILLAAAAFTLSALTVSVLRTNVVVSFLSFVTSAIIMTYLLLHVRSAAVLAPPAVAVGIALALRAEILPVLITAALILVLAGTTALMLLKRAAPFTLFLALSALYFTALGSFAFITLKTSYGSVSAGIEELKKIVSAAVDDALGTLRSSGSFQDVSVDSGSLTDAVFALIPAAVMIFSMIASAAHTAALKLLSRLSGTRELLFPEKLSTPVSFAVMFIISAVLSFLSASSSPPWSYVIVNVNYVLMAYFAAIGVMEIIRSITGSRPGSGRKTVTIVLLAAALAVGWFSLAMFLPVLLPILSYFGAFRSIKSRKKPDEPR